MPLQRPRRVVDELRDLHDLYVEEVNHAVAEDDLVRVERLVEDHDRQALQLMVPRGGRPPLGPAVPPRPTVARRLAHRLKRAA